MFETTTKLQADGKTDNVCWFL